MPIYAFECGSCGHQFDRLQKLSDPDPEICPACAAAQIRRQLTAPSFRLSGSGWYETDFKKEGDKKRNLAETSETKKSSSEAKSQSDSNPKSDSSTNSVAKTETKTEAKPESKPSAKSESTTST